MGKAKKLWTSLIHKGPVLAPPIERVPKRYKFKYDGKPKRLNPETEECALIYARYLRGKPRPKQILKDNFFESWQKVMTRAERREITTLAKCDFAAFQEYIEKQAEDRRNMTREEKRREKAKKAKKEQKYKEVKVNGKKELLNNMMVEPPGLYLGRGNNKNIGRLKKRVTEEDITINCSNPKSFPNRQKYKEVKCDQTVGWIASWTDNITGRTKYIYLHPSSNIKTNLNQAKFAMAKKLGSRISVIQKTYKGHLSSKNLVTRQLATATYLIHNFALRIGNEKTCKNDAQTAGCTSLEKKHVLDIDGDEVELKFKGKDSILFERTLKVTPKVAQNLAEFYDETWNGKIFYEINAQKLNDYLEGLMPGLTAKVFRTYMATQCFCKEMSKQVKAIPKKGSAATDPRQKVLAIKMANMEVAKFLNHKKLTNATKQAKNKVIQKQIKTIRSLEERRRDAKDRLGCNAQSNISPRIVKLDQDISLRKRELELKELVEYAPQTSKANYIDPRDIVKWCKKLKVPAEKVFTPAEMKKFEWAVKGRGSRS